MNKWADYLICKVRYNKEQTHIISVKYRTENNGIISSTDLEFSRQDVIQHIKDGKIFVTMYQKTPDSGWSKGKEVIIIKIDGTEYIKTDRNNTKRDNLENLPEY